MRSGRCLAIAALFVILPSLHAQTQDGEMFTASPQQLAAVKVVLAQQRAWNAGDLSGFLARYRDEPDTEAILGQTAKGLGNIRALFHASYPSHDSMGQIEYSDFDSHALGPEYTLVVAHYVLARSKKAGGGAEGTLTEVVQKTGDTWQIIFSQTT